MWKKSSLLGIIAALAMAVSAGSATAQTFKVASGSKGLTYNAQLTNIKDTCSKEIAIVEEPSTGAVANVELLLDNKINGAWVQADILHRYARTRGSEMATIKTLLVMHREALHFITKRQASETGMGSKIGALFKDAKVDIKEIQQLNGMTVATSGGGVETAKQVRTETEINYKIMEVKDSAEALKNLALDRADAALIVTGQGADAIKTLGKEYRIVTIPAAIQEKLKGAYTADTVSYSNMGSEGVPTVSVQALFVTREYTTDNMKRALSALRNCVLTNLDNIRENGGHKTWWQIKREDQVNAKWPLYKLPEVAAVAPLSKK